MVRSSSSDLPALQLVAHELRAHLTVLNGYSSLLLEDERVRRDPAMLEHALTRMRSHLETLTEISSHLVDAVRDGDAAGRLPMDMTAIDLAAAAREALAMSAEVAGRHNVHLSLDDRGLGDGPVRGDRFQLVMAMRNLLDNACAHGPDGGAVTLRISREDGDVVIRVHDQGRGLDLLGQRAFEPRRRARRAGQDSEAGLGLGLSLVAEVARAHDGEVTWDRDRRGASIGMRLLDQAPLG